MKHKIPFGLTVFTTLVLFMAIFVTYLERESVNGESKQGSEYFNAEIGNTDNLVSLISKSFTTSFTGVVSGDR
jgi:hypothetical protein